MNRLRLIADYGCVTKPGIVFSNLIAATGGFMLASRGNVDVALLASTIAGIGLVIAAGCVFNNCIDRNLDRKMRRTCRRALAAGRIPLPAAVAYAALLGTAGTFLLGVTTNWRCVVVTLTGLTIYVCLYSLWLKPRSPYSTLIGSLAGAAPPLAGYCAAHNGFDMGALLLVAIFSLWQLPHFYAIAIARLPEYTAAGIPVAPAKNGIPQTKKRIAGYILIFAAVALLPTGAGCTGNRYLGVVALAVLIWLGTALWRYHSSDDRIWARRVFILSILIITTVSAMLAIDGTRYLAGEALLRPAHDSRVSTGTPLALLRPPPPDNGLPPVVLGQNR